MGSSTSNPTSPTSIFSQPNLHLQNKNPQNHQKDRTGRS